jgi:RimJ/RimL family protein N-acetyltransferase
LHSAASRNVVHSHLLVLRELTVEEAADIAVKRVPPGQRWAEGYPLEGTLIATRMLMGSAQNGTLRAGFGMYQLLERASGVVIGDIGFHAALDAEGALEIGYGIVPEFRGRGLVSHAVRTLTRWALHQPGVKLVVAKTEADHLPSRRVLDAAGFEMVAAIEGICRYRLLRSSVDDGNLCGSNRRI